MHRQLLRQTYMQCGAETDRRAPEAHRTAHQFRQLARSRPLPKDLEAFFKARDAYMAAAAADTQVFEARPDRGSGQVVLQPGAAAPLA